MAASARQGVGDGEGLGEWFSEGIPEVKSAGLRLFDKRQFDFGAHCSVSKECSLAQQRRRHDDRQRQDGHHHCSDEHTHQGCEEERSEQFTILQKNSTVTPTGLRADALTQYSLEVV